MCGIIGSFKTNINIDKGLKLLQHRGPDAYSYHKIGDMIHGHTRLSIIDLNERSNQPFIFKTGCLSFNGEIWNYLDLKKELQDLGYSFNTDSDTEVLAIGLYHFGINFVRKLDGMFAFAWSNENTNILVRDRWGECPLFLVHSKGKFVWSSEQKALTQLGYKDIAMFKPAHILDLNSQKYVQYYNYPKLQNIKADSKKVINLLDNAVKKRLMSDVPIACLLSGGLDSSLISLLTHKYHRNLTCYIAVFDKESSDLKNARKLAKDFNLKLKEIHIKKPIIQDIRNVIFDIESNMKAQIEIALLCDSLAREIAKDGIKVILSGEGADEIFGGYGNTAIQASKMNDSQYQELQIKLIQKMAWGNFQRTNLIFLKYGIEARLPFVDYELLDYILTLNKSENRIGKKLLKESAKNIVPDYIINRTKETFQGSANIPQYIENLIPDTKLFYNRIYKNLYGQAKRV